MRRLLRGTERIWLVDFRLRNGEGLFMLGSNSLLPGEGSNVFHQDCCQSHAPGNTNEKERFCLFIPLEDSSETAVARFHSLPFVRVSPRSYERIKIGTSLEISVRGLLDYNILVTFHSHERKEAVVEINARLSDLGIKLEDMMESEFPGVMLVRVEGSPRDAVRLLNGLCRKFPEVFKFTHRWAPIERWVALNDDAMVRGVEEIGSGINDKDRWKLSLFKRGYEKHSAMEMIKLLTDHINRGKVDLEHPDKIIEVQMVSDAAGISLIREDEYLDVNKVRESLGIAKLP